VNEAPGLPPAPAGDPTTPSAAPPAASAPASPPLARFRLRVAAWFAHRFMGPRWMAVAAIGVAGLALLFFGFRLDALGASFGLLALAASWVALAPTPQPGGRGHPFATGMALLVDLLLGIGLVSGAVAGQQPLRAILGFVVLVVLAFLPHLEAVAPPGVLAREAGFWSRNERILVLMAGGLLGSATVAMLLVGLVGVLDAWYRLGRLARAGGPDAPATPGFLGALLTPEGALHPVVRIGSLALGLLLLVLLRGSR
jgi:hypothetical protein